MNLIPVCAGIAVAAFALSALAEPTGGGRNRYLFCNVYTSGACFGLAAGDEMQMQLGPDFTVYTVTLQSRQSITIYSGYHPQRVTKEISRESNCAVASTFPTCERREFSDGSLEILFANGPDSTYLQAVVPQARGGALVEEFLKNIQPCKRTGNSIQCKVD